MKSSQEAFAEGRTVWMGLRSFDSRGTFPQQSMILTVLFARHRSMNFNCLTNSENSQISCTVCLNEELSFCSRDRHFAFLLLIFTWRVFEAVIALHQTKTDLRWIEAEFWRDFVHEVHHLMRYRPLYLIFLFLIAFEIPFSSFTSLASFSLVFHQKVVPTRLKLLDPSP